MPGSAYQRFRLLEDDSEQINEDTRQDEDAAENNEKHEACRMRPMQGYPFDCQTGDQEISRYFQFTLYARSGIAHKPGPFHIFFLSMLATS